MLSVTFDYYQAECHAESRYAESHYAESLYAESRYAEPRYAECHYAKYRCTNTLAYSLGALQKFYRIVDVTLEQGDQKIWKKITQVFRKKQPKQLPNQSGHPALECDRNFCFAVKSESLTFWRHDIWHNGIQHTDIQDNITNIWSKSYLIG